MGRVISDPAVEVALDADLEGKNHGRHAGVHHERAGDCSVLLFLLLLVSLLFPANARGQGVLPFFGEPGQNQVGVPGPVTAHGAHEIAIPGPVVNERHGVERVVARGGDGLLRGACSVVWPWHPVYVRLQDAVLQDGALRVGRRLVQCNREFGPAGSHWEVDGLHVAGAGRNR